MSRIEKRNFLLGEPYATARTRLIKMILFKLIVGANKNICYRCNNKIDTLEELSIEHKHSWINSDNPKQLFYDLENIAFSHLLCNSLNGSINSLDKKLKGEDHQNSKLTYNQVNEIRNNLEKGFSLGRLAKEYNTSKRNIALIRDKKIWK